MGFIDWHGNKKDHFEDILEFAKMKEQMEADNFGSQMRKKAEASLFGVPELLSMETEEILKLLLKEKKSLDILYDVLVKNSESIKQLGIDEEMSKQFYDDFLRCSMEQLFQKTNIDENRAKQFIEIILTKIFKVNNAISFEEHYRRKERNPEYSQYLSRSFELKSGNVTLFWQWIRYLSELSAKRNEGSQFIKLYQRFMMHLSYYTNQLVIGAEVGKKYAERRKINAEILQHSLSTKIDISNLHRNMKNPIFHIWEEEEIARQSAEKQKVRMQEEAAAMAAELKRKARAEQEAKRRAEADEAERKRIEDWEAAQRRKKLLRLMKCARAVLGYYILATKDDNDMIIAGRLYSAIKDKKIKLERLVSIFPSQSVGIVKSGSLPVVTTEDVRFKLDEREFLHYIEYATIYKQGMADEDIDTLKGTLFITNKKIQIEAGQKVFVIPYGQLEKAVVYDVMPGVMELSGSRDTYFVRTADTELAYNILRMILGSSIDLEPEEEPEPMNMEEIKIDFLETANLSSYIYGIQTMMDENMPEDVQEDLGIMIQSLKYLDIALKKYPSYVEKADSFFSYYIPEAVKLLYSYNEYEKAGLGEEKINPVYEKVITAVKKLSMAAKQQVVDIYRDAIVDTTARAEALTEILGQDGFIDPAFRIK